MNWRRIQLPRPTIVISSILMLPGVIGAVLILVFLGSLQGNLVLAAFAFGLAVSSIIIVWISGIRASPSRVGFSNLGVHAELSRQSKRRPGHLGAGPDAVPYEIS